MSLRHPITWLCMIFCLFCQTACTPPAVTPAPVPSAQPAAPTRAPTATASPPPSPTSTAVPPTLTPLPQPQVCSPLQDISIAQLPDQISNPYHPPAPGSDDPHQGVDLADFAPGSRMAIKGRAVQAVLPGRVAMVTQDRFPYGYAILIETPLNAYAPDGWTGAQIPTLAPTLAHVQALTCPAPGAVSSGNAGQRSLYLLYAHLQTPPQLAPGDSAACGQIIGQVGDSGNALNPHLHLEARVGPSGMTMTSLAHYDASATAEEMGNYCLWRVSGLFQLVDPMNLFALAP